MRNNHLKLHFTRLVVPQLSPDYITGWVTAHTVQEEQKHVTVSEKAANKT